MYENYVNFLSQLFHIDYEVIAFETLVHFLCFAHDGGRKSRNWLDLNLDLRT